MSAIRILWIDLRCQSDGPGLVCLVPDKHVVTTEEGGKAISDAVRSARPDLACVEFDYPDKPHLLAVPLIRREFPSLPLLMFTEYHSEALAVQAFRLGVWDYRVKPVSETVLARSIEFAAGMSAQRDRRHDRYPAMPPDLVAPGGHLLGPVATTIKTASAVAYIASHYTEQINRKAMAALCHLSVSEFSRTFRREHECTFEHFLLEFRIAKARELLVATRLTITQVAHAAGFNDSSYFARAFRRLFGVSASDWRRRAGATRQTVTV